MFHLLMRPTPRRQHTLRRLAGLITGVAREFTHSPVAADIVDSVKISTEPVDPFEANELPPATDIATAAEVFAQAATEARAADRSKRAARKILDRLPSGQYGAWTVSRKANARQTADLDAIRETYKRLGLGPVPMKTSALSLVVERAAILAEVTA